MSDPATYSPTRGARGRRGLSFDGVTAPVVETLPRIRPLRYEVQFEGGAPVVVDFSMFPDRPLVRVLAQAPRRALRVTVLAEKRNALVDGLSTLRSIVAFLVAVDPLVNSLEAITPDMIDSYEACLKRVGGNSSNWYHKLKEGIWWLKNAFEEAGITPGPALRNRLAYTSEHRRPRDRLIEPLDPLTHQRLLDACKAACRATLKRITVVGEKYLKIGRDPRVVDGEVRQNETSERWRQPENWLWMAERMLDDGRFMSSQWAADAGVQSLLNTRTPFRGMADVYAHLYPTSLDLVPFLIRLILVTRLAPESVTGLSVRDLREAEEGDTLTFIKRRSGHSDPQSKVYPKRGPGSIGFLFRQVQRITARARERHQTDALWVSFALKGGKYFTVCRFENDLIQLWLERFSVLDSTDQRLTHLDLRRLRKTGKAKRYIEVGGNLEAFADDHSPRVAAKHYATTEALRPLHDATIENALRKALSLADLKATVLTPAQEAELKSAPPAAAAERLNVAPSRVLPMLSGERDVTLAACKDLTNSPFAEPGETCPASAWGCFVCANAVITSRHLPMHLSLINHLERERAVLSDSEWEAAHGQTYTQAQTVLARFTDDQVMEARAVAEAYAPLLFLPINMLANGGVA